MQSSVVLFANQILNCMDDTQPLALPLLNDVGWNTKTHIPFCTPWNIMKHWDLNIPWIWFLYISFAMIKWIKNNHDSFWYTMRDVTSQERIAGNMMCDLQRCTTESMGRQNVVLGVQKLQPCCDGQSLKTWVVGPFLTLSFLLLNSWQSGNKLTDPEPFNLMLPRCIEDCRLGECCRGRNRQAATGSCRTAIFIHLSPRFPTPIGPAGLIQGCLMVEMQIGCMSVPVVIHGLLRYWIAWVAQVLATWNSARDFLELQVRQQRVSRFRNHGGSLVPEVSCNWSVVYLS